MGLTRGNQHDAATTVGLSAPRVRLHHGQRGMLDGKESSENTINCFFPDSVLSHKTYERALTRTFSMNSSGVMSCRSVADTIPA